MTYTIRYGYGHHVHTIREVNGVWRVGELVTIERVLLDQNKTNIPNVVYTGTDGIEYKENQLYVDRLDARRECLRRNSELSFQ